MHNVVCGPFRERHAIPHNVNAWQPSESALRRCCPAYEVGRRPCEQRRRSRPGLLRATALLVRRWVARGAGQAPQVNQKAGVTENLGLDDRFG